MVFCHFIVWEMFSICRNTNSSSLIWCRLYLPKCRCCWMNRLIGNLLVFSFCVSHTHSFHKNRTYVQLIPPVINPNVLFIASKCKCKGKWKTPSIYSISEVGLDSPLWKEINNPRRFHFVEMFVFATIAFQLKRSFVENHSKHLSVRFKYNTI